ncbi:MAG: ATP phosphoribosyltransferase regulatory subunit [Clostridiales bacterium]|jgi:ATP phosphoribosyltransferase regulatory subunit|nr:ATP phosphoribosyltransferase regulatory subunit [Clostridiales bacterium]
MKSYRLPFGVQDYMPDECANKELAEGRLAAVFRGRGYERVAPGTLEFYDAFADALGRGGLNKMFKLTDSDGSLLVLRPDITLQIMRIAASKLDLSEPNRLYYIENSFEYLSDNSSARSREFSQAGVELLGESGAGGDVETVLTAIEALESTGLKNFLLDVGSVEFFRSLCEEFSIPDALAARFAPLIDNKDLTGLESALSGANVTGARAEAFLALPSLYGGAEVLGGAAKICGGKGCENALNKLSAVLDAAKICGRASRVAVDLGMQKGGYYTGLVIRGVARGSGVTILDGGRYDALGNKFGIQTEAVGFAIGTRRLLNALDNEGSTAKGLAPCDAAYVSDGFSPAENAEVGRMRARGERVVKLFCGEERLIKYCAARGIKRAFVFTDGKMREAVKCGK